MTFLDRRTFLGAASALPFLSVATATVAESNNTSTFSDLTREETLQTYVRLIGSTQPAVCYTWFSGHLWGVTPDRTPAPLVSVEGLAKNVWRVSEDNVMSQQNFDLGFFGDVESGDILDEFVNPFTGETVAPYHYLYGGGTSRYTEGGIQSGENTTPIEPRWIVSGDQVWVDETMHASIPNPFDPVLWPRESSGDQFRFGSTSTYVANAAHLLDPSRSAVPYQLSWNSLTSWEPWLLMGDAPGYVMWRATGRKLTDLSEAPARIREYAERTVPGYLENQVPWAGTRSTMRSFMNERDPASRSS